MGKPQPTQLPNYPIIKITKMPLKWKTQIPLLHPALSFSGSKSEIGKFHQISKKKKITVIPNSNFAPNQ